MWALVNHQTKMETDRGSGRYRPNKGDLVLVRDKVLDGQRGRKLDPKWKGPRIVESVSEHGLSALVKELYGEGKTRRYHVDDLKQYLGRDRPDQQEDTESTIRTARTAMNHAGLVGQRAVFVLERTC
jgi:hypothetical protein